MSAYDDLIDWIDGAESDPRALLAAPATYAALLGTTPDKNRLDARAATLAA